MNNLIININQIDILQIVHEKVHTFSVIIRSTHCFPVNGNEHSSKILCVPPLAVCSIATTTLVPGAATRSMAPPIPFTNLPYQTWREEHLITID